MTSLHVISSSRASPCVHCPTTSQRNFCLRARVTTRRQSTSCRAEEENDKIKRRKAFGEWLLESEDPAALDQPPERDFWEGSQFDIIGKTAGFAIPVLLVLFVLVGLFAAGGYNNGANEILKPASSPEDKAQIFPKD